MSQCCNFFNLSIEKDVIPYLKIQRICPILWSKIDFPSKIRILQHLSYMVTISNLSFLADVSVEMEEVIDLNSLRGNGLQPNETQLPDDGNNFNS